MKSAMKAVSRNRYGGPQVLEIQDVTKPVPKSNEILVKIRASSVTAADVMMRRGAPKFGRLFLGLFKPQDTGMGTGFSGIVESMGSEVPGFSIGESVFGEVLFGEGTNAEYVCVKHDELVFPKPDILSHSQAASLGDGAVTSLNFLNLVTNVRPGNRVLINGASGSLGTAAVQIAIQQGANVTALCSSKNRRLVESLGADSIMDYTDSASMTHLEQYDVIYDTVGALAYRAYTPFLSDSGVFISPVLRLRFLLDVFLSLFSKKSARFSATGLLPIQELRGLYSDVIELVRAGDLRQVVDREYSLDQVREAHTYVETGRKVANIALIANTDEE